MRPYIELKNVTKKIRGNQIIDHLSFEVFGGELFGLLGPNGAGKTTTIRMMVGLNSVTSGEIVICGKNVAKDFEKAIRYVGAIVENPAFYPFLTGYENLQQFGRMTRGVTKEKMAEVVTLVGLDERIHEKVKTYSLGMRQRLGIAQSLLHNPKILILDEPTNGLDPAGIRDIRNYLRKLAKEKGLAIVVSSHLLSEMELMCDRIAIIQKGKLLKVQNVGKDGHKENALYHFHVNKAEEATRLIIDNLNIQPIVKGKIVEMKLPRRLVPQVIKLFVGHNILIYEATKITKTLEEQFFEITNGSEGAANVSVS